MTPSQFLNAPILNMNPEWDIATTARNLESETSRVKRLLWDHMKAEITKGLTKSSYVKEAEPLAPGEIVLIKGQEWRPDRWPLALVTEVFEGKDGRVRVVRVRSLKMYDKRSHPHETIQSTKNLLRIKLPPATKQRRLFGTEDSESDEREFEFPGTLTKPHDPEQC